MKTILKWISWLNRLNPKGPALSAQDQLFDDYFISGKLFYLNEFGTIPNIFYLGGIDGNKIIDWIKAGNAGTVSKMYQRRYYDWSESRQSTSMTLIQMEEAFILEVSSGYVYIYYGIEQAESISRLVEQFIPFEDKVEEGEFNIFVISRGRSGLELKELSIAPTTLDIGLFYNDDFIAVDQVIRERLLTEKDKGIILLHGIPGTGKTTYLRHIVGQLKKKVLFVSPNVAVDLMDPEFIDLMIDNPNAVLVIEDAENIIFDRRYNSRSGVSNLLNISDGLLSDCLNVQIICTFNSALHLIDPALLRKGRLIARYEFGKLSVEKAQKLAETLGLKQLIDQPLTLAELTNPGGYTDEIPKVEVIGFRRQFQEN